jgi:bifunctional polynucleotide phosphatase/kinase
MWIETESYLNYNGEKDLKNKLACFDIDGTIIRTLSGRIKAQNKLDWTIIYDNCKNILKELSEDNYSIIFISNQYVLKNDEHKKEWKSKIDNIIKYINLDITVYASLKKDKYRKPNIGFLKLLDYNNKEKVFYVGDAAGRERDYASYDRKFAENGKILFFTPEEVFLEDMPVEKYLYTYPKLPKSINSLDNIINKFNLLKNDKELIINVGYPGSGKSFMSQMICENIPDKYVIISRDIEKTIPMCIKKCKEILSGTLKSVIIDNLNNTKTDRRKFIDIANSLGILVRCFYYTTSQEISKHNNHYRAIIKNEKALIPDVVYNKYKKYFEIPNKQENYDDIIKIKFIPILYDNQDKLRYYNLLECY